jgi:hypothetical protein
MDEEGALLLVVEMAVGEEQVLQEGDVEFLAQFMEHPVEIAGVDEGAAFVQNVDIAALCY